MTQLFTRRDFVRRSALIAATIPVSRWGWTSHAPLVLRIGVVDASGDVARRQRLGIELGVDEAKHAAQLFGGAIEVTPLGALPHSQTRVSAVIGGGDDARASAAWIDGARAMDIVYMNIGCTSDELRGANCAAAAFHVIPSDAMYRDAVALAGSSTGVDAVAWDTSLSRFGADTLNQRFRTRFNTPMTTESWAGWLAVKILWESALRQKSGEGAALASYLSRETTQFDGHKGQPLSFRVWDHQLRQPVYVVQRGADGTRSAKEVPETAAGDSPRDALDRLGTPRTRSSCRLS